MRILHTADWHLGRLLYGARLTGDQAHAIDQIVTIARDQQVDAVVIAGDIYDRAVPPPDAVALLDDALVRLSGLPGRPPVILISGNHDSASRLAFGARLLERAGVHVVTEVSAVPKILTLHDAHGEVALAAIPYTEPAALAAFAPDAPPRTHDEALGQQLAAARAAIPDGVRAVAIAHAHVAGGSGDSSERALFTGDQAVRTARFAGFAYGALGHLHRPQTLEAEGAVVHYPGPPVKLSFAETGAVGVTIVEVAADGAVALERHPIRPLRDVRRIEGTLVELLGGPADAERADDYLAARLTDERPVFDAHGRLREVYPNLLLVERRDPAAPADAADPAELELAAAGPKGQVARFDAFFGAVEGRGLDRHERAVLEAVAEALAAEAREADPLPDGRLAAVVAEALTRAENEPVVEVLPEPAEPIDEPADLPTELEIGPPIAARLADAVAADAVAAEAVAADAVPVEAVATEAVATEAVATEAAASAALRGAAAPPRRAADPAPRAVPPAHPGPAKGSPAGGSSAKDKLAAARPTSNSKPPRPEASDGPKRPRQTSLF